MAQVIFNFKGTETKIDCKTNENMGNILNKFLSLNGLKNTANITYLYNGSNSIDPNKSFIEQANGSDKKDKTMSILVDMNEEEEDNIIISNDIICPECKENILIKITDFNVHLYGCKHNHKFNK